MIAAELLAVHGGSADPTVRLASVEDLGQLDSVEKAAMRRLKAVRALAEIAWRFARCCRGHTSMCSALLDSPIENSLMLAQREYNNATTAVLNALPRAEAAKAEVTAARQILGC
jgi:hypothetical protein